MQREDILDPRDSNVTSDNFPHLSTAFPAPSSAPNHTISILVYGAGSTTGQYTLHAAGHTNVLATASLKHHAFLRTLGATLTADVARAVGGDGKVALALNAITMEGTLVRIAEVLSAQGTLTLLLPIKAGEAPMHWEVLAERNPFPARARQLDAQDPPGAPRVGAHPAEWVRLLDQGTFKERVATGLDLLRNNRIRGEKVVVTVDFTGND
ncbi:hypothetical protein DFH08DRAFT_816502 [Mycena albidolilacea]|uniref:Uncharacterized protein n=1 Tax=Mycena albidolilacea TaxID=1033008 RepID=A0AAD6ZLX8_9AGAR|nr:hypothetical protein DFH08DRAFT_816502 [Mycena albidolilacea]